MPGDNEDSKKAKIIKEGALEGNAIRLWGNGDTKILAEAFLDFSKNGLTQGDKNTIEKLDDVLKGADIIINKEGTLATIIQPDGSGFRLDINVGHQFTKNNIDGTSEAKILAEAYLQLKELGISSEYRITVEKLDDILEGADISLEEKYHGALIAQQDGTVFNSVESSFAKKEVGYLEIPFMKDTFKKFR